MKKTYEIDWEMYGLFIFSLVFSIISFIYFGIALGIVNGILSIIFLTLIIIFARVKWRGREYENE